VTAPTAIRQCGNGHDLTAANSRRRADGRVDCRVCTADRQRRHSARRRVLAGKPACVRVGCRESQRFGVLCHWCYYRDGDVDPVAVLLTLMDGRPAAALNNAERIEVAREHFASGGSATQLQKILDCNWHRIRKIVAEVKAVAA